MSNKSMGVTIRSMRLVDIDQVVEIEKQIYAKPWSKDRFVEEIRRPRIVPLVAIVDGKIVGFMLYNPRSDYFVIASIGVAAEYRRRGIGRLLVTRLICRLGGENNWAGIPQNYRDRIVVDTSYMPVESQEAFARMGFERCKGIAKMVYRIKRNE